MPDEELDIVCPCVRVLSDISHLQGWNQLAVHLYMVWGYALVVPPGKIFFVKPPVISLGGHPEFSIVPIENHAAHAASCMLLYDLMLLLLHLCPASQTPDSLTLFPVWCCSIM